MIKLLLNATICDVRPTGLGVYTQNIIKEMNRYQNINSDILINTAVGKLIANKNQIVPTHESLLSSKGWKAQLKRIFFLNIFGFNTKKYDMLLNTVPEGSLFVPSKKQITVIHDILPILFREEYSKSHYYYKYYVPLLLRKSRHIVVPSENTKKDVVSYYGIKEAKVHVAYNGYDNLHFNPKSSEEIRVVKEKYDLDKYFLYIGNLYPHKNLNRVIEAFAQFSNTHPDYEFIIAGDKNHWNYENLQNLIAELKMEKKIRFLDYVPFNELPILYSGSTSFVYPSLYEGFGLPVIEGMACGAAVITSNNSSLNEIVGDAAIKVNPQSIDEISLAMSRVVEDEGLRINLISMGLNHAKSFTWGRTAKTICSLMNKTE